MKPSRAKGSVLERVLYSKTALIVGIVFIVILGNATIHLYGKYTEAKIRSLKAEKDLTRLENREEVLREDIDRLNTARGAEEEFRRRFNVAAAGEHVIVVVNPESSTDITGGPKEGGVWQKFLNLIQW